MSSKRFVAARKAILALKVALGIPADLPTSRIVVDCDMAQGAVKVYLQAFAGEQVVGALADRLADDTPDVQECVAVLLDEKGNVVVVPKEE